MFLSSYEKLRQKILDEKTLISLVRPEYHAFFESAYVPICAFVLFSRSIPNYRGSFIDLQAFYGADKQSIKALEAIKNRDCGWFFQASSEELKTVPGAPIVYWIGENVRNLFGEETIDSIAKSVKGLDTCDNDRFVRLWSETTFNSCSFPFSTARLEPRKKWYPYCKGGGFRKWYGNFEYTVNWGEDGAEIRNFRNPDGSIKSRPQNIEFYFRKGITFSSVTSSLFSCRIMEQCIFGGGGNGIFTEDVDPLIGFLNSKLNQYFMSLLNPTLNMLVGDINRLPYIAVGERIERVISKLVAVSKQDWDSIETSWDFTSLPLLNPDYRQPTLKATYQTLRAHWREVTLEMQRLEQENNRIFIDAYGLQDELKPEVPLTEITLTCNPHYRYGNDKSEDELEGLLLADTMRELVSYAVGCMFGRYALDKPGLILANQGETIEDYLKRVPEPSFPADDDNVIPMLDGDWFTDDIAERFRKFLRVAFGDEHYEANLKFVEKALGKNGKARDIRDYFLKDFYSDHVKRYKKRPIYWLFSSPKGSFNALIYMHRYRPDTVSVVLNDYLREFRTKLTSHKNHLEAVSISASSSQGEKTKALKEIEKITKMIAEMEEYEREVLYPLATEQVEIDLDDGVKHNYANTKLATALKKIVGLDAKED